MIYATAQRVIASDGRTGINAYLYQSASALPHGESGVVDAELALEERGDLVAYEQALRSGGNQVQSYVDFLLPSAEAKIFEELTSGTLEALSKGPPPIAFETARGALLFDIDVGFAARRLRPQQELLELAGAARKLLGRGGPPAWSEVEKLVVRVERGEHETRYKLDRKSEQRVVHALAHPATLAPITLQHETRSQLEHLHGSFFPHVAALLTQLDDEQLLRLGGVVFIDSDGKTLWEWPPPHAESQRAHRVG